MLVKFLYIVFAYLYGSIPFAYIIAKMVGGVNIYEVGSNNPGAANVFRSIGKCAGILTLLADTVKGFIPVYFAVLIDNTFYYSITVAVAAITGHVFTVFFKFKGGKGVATGLGVLLALMPLTSVVGFSVFVLVFIFSGYVALGSICAAVSLPLISYFLGYTIEYVGFTLAITIFVIYKHKANIKRLRKGSENRFILFNKKSCKKKEPK
jgi:glycerol-3-phosphate acyltransferase PlsY